MAVGSLCIKLDQIILHLLIEIILRINKYSPSNRSSNRKNSPSAVSTGSKRKKTPSRNSSDGSPTGNRLYSPSGRPRDNSPNSNQRKPGAVQRFHQAVSPKSKSKKLTKQEIHKQYNEKLREKNKRSKHGSKVSSKGRPGSSSIYSNKSKKKNTSMNRSGSARSKKSSRIKYSNKSKDGKYLPKYEKEVKMKELDDSSAKKRKNKLVSCPDENEIQDIEERINKLQNILESSQAQT